MFFDIIIIHNKKRFAVRLKYQHLFSFLISLIYARAISLHI